MHENKQIPAVWVILWLVWKNRNFRAKFLENCRTYQSQTMRVWKRKRDEPLVVEPPGGMRLAGERWQFQKVRGCSSFFSAASVRVFVDRKRTGRLAAPSRYLPHCPGSLGHRRSWNLCFSATGWLPLIGLRGLQCRRWGRDQCPVQDQRGFHCWRQ